MSRVLRPRVLLADDHRLVAEGLKSLLSAEFELVGVVEDGRALIEAARKLRPDVIVADITMPHLNGIDALVQLKQDDERVRVVFLTMHPEVAYARRALEAGALGYVLKHSAPSELIAAIRAALDGKTWLTPAAGGRSAAVHETRAGQSRRSRGIAHAAAAGDSPIAGGRPLGEGDRRHAGGLGPHGGVPQIPDDGEAGPAHQRRTGSLRDQARHRGDLRFRPVSANLATLAAWTWIGR